MVLVIDKDTVGEVRPRATCKRARRRERSRSVSRAATLSSPLLFVTPAAFPSSSSVRRGVSKGGERAAPLYVRRYSSTIVVPSITQLLLKKLALYLDRGPNLSVWNRFIFDAKYLPILKQAKNIINAVKNHFSPVISKFKLIFNLECTWHHK